MKRPTAQHGGTRLEREDMPENPKTINRSGVSLICKIRINKTKEVYWVFGEKISYFDDLQQNIVLFNFVVMLT